jgi:hypothetical protein
MRATFSCDFPSGPEETTFFAATRREIVVAPPAESTIHLAGMAMIFQRWFDGQAGNRLRRYWLAVAQRREEHFVGCAHRRWRAAWQFA